MTTPTNSNTRSTIAINMESSQEHLISLTLHRLNEARDFTKDVLPVPSTGNRIFQWVDGFSQDEVYPMILIDGCGYFAGNQILVPEYSNQIHLKEIMLNTGLILDLSFASLEHGLIDTLIDFDHIDISELAQISMASKLGEEISPYQFMHETIKEYDKDLYGSLTSDQRDFVVDFMLNNRRKITSSDWYNNRIVPTAY